MRAGLERLVTGATVIVLGLVVVAVSYAGQAGIRSPYPFGTERPSGCSAYGLSTVQNISYWYCDTNINSTFWYAAGPPNWTFVPLAHFVYVDVEFTLEGFAGMEAPGISVTGLELHGANYTLDIGPYRAVGAPWVWPTPLTFSPDDVFGAQWVSPGSVELLVS